MGPFGRLGRGPVRPKPGIPTVLVADKHRVFSA